MRTCWLTRPDPVLAEELELLLAITARIVMTERFPAESEVCKFDFAYYFVLLEPARHVMGLLL